jgi:hypothetical protein
MKRVFSICCTLAMLAAFGLPGLASAQSKPAADAKLEQLEAKLQALLAEIKAMRSASSPPAKYDASKPTQLRVTVDGDKVTIVDAVTGKVISGADVDKIVRWRADSGKPMDKKVVIVGDDAKKPGADTRTERKVIVLGPDGKEVKGERKVVVVEEKGKGDDAKPRSAFELKEGAFRFEVPSAPATPAAPKAPAAPRAPSAPALPAQPGAGTMTWSIQPRSTASQPARVASFTESGSSSETVMLSRTTYSLAGNKARALDAFLKENVKTKVLETRIEGEKLIVTTTPEVQSTIGALVSIMTGKSPASAQGYRLQLTQPSAPLPPRQPAKPKQPEDD